MISVCMATYNGEKYIREQLESILKQISPNDEIVISDDNSTDTTTSIINSIGDSRIRLCFNDKSKHGYTNNFENALKKARGDFVFLSDQDDVWIDGKVNACMSELGIYDFVVTDAKIVNSSLSLIAESHFILNGVKRGYWRNLWATRYIGACMAFKKDVLRLAIPFPERKDYCAHDYWLACVAERYFKTTIIKQPYLLYRRHENNASTGGLEKSKSSLTTKISKRLYTIKMLNALKNK